MSVCSPCKEQNHEVCAAYFIDKSGPNLIIFDPRPTGQVKSQCDCQHQHAEIMPLDNWMACKKAEAQSRADLGLPPVAITQGRDNA